MDDDVIEALADAFAEQLNYTTNGYIECEKYYKAAILDDIMAVANVIHDFEPTYDLRYFYKRAKYPEPYPIHEM